MFKRGKRDDRANRPGCVGKLLDIGDLVDTRAGPDINANVRFGFDILSKLRDAFLAFNLIGTDLENRGWKVKRFAYRPSHTVEEVIHTPSSSGRSGLPGMITIRAIRSNGTNRYHDCGKRVNRNR